MRAGSNGGIIQKPKLYISRIPSGWRINSFLSGSRRMDHVPENSQLDKVEADPPLENKTCSKQMDASRSPHTGTSVELACKKTSPDVENRLSPRKRCASTEVESKESPSATKKQRDNQDETFLKEPLPSPQERRKSLRRSSAKKHRRSLPPLYYNTTELSDAISLELPESDRLCELLQSCFQFSVQKLEESLKYTDGFDREAFGEKVLSVTQKVKRFSERLARDGTLRKCTDKTTSFTPSPETEALQKHMKEHISKFSSECQSWDQLLEDYRTKAEVISRELLENKLSADRSAGSSHLHTSQDKVIHSKPDYSSVLNQQGAVFDCMEIVLDELQESIHLLNSLLGDTTRHLQEMSTQLKSRSFKQLEDSPVRKFLKISQK